MLNLWTTMFSRGQRRWARLLSWAMLALIALLVLSLTAELWVDVASEYLDALCLFLVAGTLILAAEHYQSQKDEEHARLSRAFAFAFLVLGLVLFGLALHFPLWTPKAS